MVLFDQSRQTASWTDSVGSHHDGMELVVGIQVFQTQGFGVFVSEFEGVPDFDAFLEADMTLMAGRTDIAFLDLTYIRNKRRGEIAKVRVLEVDIGFVGADDEIAHQGYLGIDDDSDL